MVNTPEELGAWLRLVLTPGVGPESARRLLAAFGEPQALFAQTETALCQVVNAKQAQALRIMPDGCVDLIQNTLDWLQTANGPGRCVITLGDADYPAPLLDIPDPPLMLYALGQTAQLATLRAEQALAMVGSRNPTPQGAENARAFAFGLAASGLTVVSGLALGVDGAAHEGALQGATKGQLATIAVVGTGLDRVYPRQHRELAHRIAQNGLILSEYPLGTPPLSPNFPRRNRLISGLSQATLVVEAAVQSGSLITAKQALEQGRDVLAIPGSIHSAQSKGCHALIKQGAKLVETVQDVLEELQLPTPDVQQALDLPAPPPEDEPSGHDPERALLRAMGHDPVGLDALQVRCGWPTAQLQAQLLELELMGQVGRLPGGLFQRMGSA
ncbi:DNA-processing protein DprA [Limnohabitans sp. Bal53]|uniref:DNA-processing protein DprA n=1 Tax=Limnohabitans sp. Bal53 TaxID=1977910 RepID=UPI000D391E1E|nr:DNA-processing protein DprA [Limnohabitans sp. Bal53]PUE43233.1 DNA protecting protein DprA [Limnohabitans sp. Bal53]